MLDNHVNAESPTSNRSRRLLDRASFADLLVCGTRNGTFFAVRIRHRGSRRTIEHYQSSDPGEVRSRIERLPKTCVVASLLPKQVYLTRVLELPEVEGPELIAMVHLEVQAFLPPEFEAAEISFRPITPRREKHRRYEVYVARCEDVCESLVALSSWGVAPTLVIPSSLVWNELLEEGGTDLLIGELGQSGLELATKEVDGTISVRSIRGFEVTSDATQLKRVIVECVWGRIGSGERANTPIVVGWLGNSSPPILTNGEIVWRHSQELNPHPDLPNEADTNIFLCFAALAISTQIEPAHLRSANLLPQDRAVAAKRRAIRKSILIASSASLATILVVLATLKVLIYRYESIGNDLAEQSADIREEGERIARRLDQLKAIHQARATQDDLVRILAGLAAATPKGVSYGGVDLSETGTIRLQGQAESLSSPFLLPEAMEKQGIFREVLLRDAGQSRKGEGSSAEFRIDSTLHRNWVR